MNPAPITEADLHAYVDGALPQERRAEIDAYLALRPAEARRLHAYGQQNSALRALFDPVLAEPVPRRLAPPPARPGWPWRRHAAGALIALAGGAAGWTLRGLDGPAQLPGPGLAQRAALAHALYSPELRHPVEVWVGQEAHLVTWLSKRLGSPLRVPALSGLGYALIGGRLLPGDRGPVAQFMYQDGGGRRLTLYVSAEQLENQETGFRFVQEGRINVFYWADGKFGYALSAALGKDELSRVAALVYEQLQPPARDRGA